MKKILICLSALFLLCSCAKEETVSDLINSSDALVESSTNVRSRAIASSSMVDSMVLIKPTKVVRVLPEDWKDKLSTSDSKYSIGKMVSGNNLWLCLIKFSDDLESSNVVECKNVTGN